MESPGKCVWFWKVLEILVQGPGKSWNFPAMWEVDTMMQVQMLKFTKIRSDFICIYEKIAGGRSSVPDPIETAVCLYI